MRDNARPDYSLFLSILKVLEQIDAPYMIIGAFAATVYGITRVTYDIDIVVDLNEDHIQALCDAYPLPRFYADPVQMRDSIASGIMFNIIDTDRGEKADLIPLSMDARYHQALQRRIRQTVEISGDLPFEVWCASPEDIIIGKLMAWEEGRSHKHETDIYEMIFFHYMGFASSFDERYVDAQASELGPDVLALWRTIKERAHQEADQANGPS